MLQTWSEAPPGKHRYSGAEKKQSWRWQDTHDTRRETQQQLNSIRRRAEEPAEIRTKSSGGGHHSGVESEERERTGLCRGHKPRARSLFQQKGKALHKELALLVTMRIQQVKFQDPKSLPRAHTL